MRVFENIAVTFYQDSVRVTMGSQSLYWMRIDENSPVLMHRDENR